MDTKKRFNVLKCGRRFGKTTLAEELIIEPALDGYPTAYYCPTYKDLNDFWINILSILKDVIVSKNEQLKQIRLITGGIIDLWSMDEPDSGRGRKYMRVVIDECEKAKKLETAWKGTIRATLTDYKGDCWFLSTPKFGYTEFKKLHSLATNPEYSHEWKSWTFTTYDNPNMDSNEIDSAKKTLDDIYFRCEYLAEDVDLEGMRWAFAFNRQVHVTKVIYNPKLITYLSFDFNRNPITCSVIQNYDDSINVVECIKLDNSDIYKLCTYIRVKYPIAQFIITGDASGSNGSAMVQDNMNYYKIISVQLGVGTNQFKVPTFNPRLEDNQVLVNSLLANYKVNIDKDNAISLIFDLENVKMLSDGSIDKTNRQDVTKQADALDTFRYYCNTFMAWFLKIK